MAYHFEGKAVFSTRNGEYARRERIPTMRTILRSHPIEDQKLMVARLQEEFPEVCKKITLPVANRDVYEHFDYCDAAVHGFEFLRAVLEYIAQLNANVNAERVSKVQDYVSRWKDTNLEAFSYIRPYHTLTDIFTEEDIEMHEVGFMTEAMSQIKNLRIQEDGNEARQSALCLQTQYTHNQRIYTQSPDPSRFPIPADSSSAQGMRATSNPECGQPQPQGGPLRHLPGTQCQLAAPQDRFPLQKLTPSTEILEHICPGSTSRGDFHSDPTAHNAMDTNDSGLLNALVAIPSRGLPGPFNYRSLPPSTQPITLLSRKGTFNRNLPKGKRNPRKKSSDDARILPSPGNNTHQAMRGPSHKRTITPEKMQISYHPRSFDTIPLVQDERSSSGAFRYSDNYHHPELHPGHHSANVQERVHCPNHHKQAPMHSVMEPYSHEYAVSNPCSPSATKSYRSIDDPHPTVPCLPEPTIVQSQVTTATQQLVEGNANLATPQVPPHSSQPLYPHVLGHQLSSPQSDVQHQQDHNAISERPALATMSNSGQAQPLVTSGQSIANETPRRSMQDGCTIWIGGLPNELDRTAVMNLLKPCRGLLNISNPKISSLSKHRATTSYTFANFQNPDDAAESLERLPQMRFASLPDGSFLCANYPKVKEYASPGHKQHESYGGSKRPMSNVSPTKLRKGEDSDHTGKSKNEHGRKPSKGSARGKESSTGTQERRPGKLSERISVASADQKESELQPEKASVSPGPNGKVGPTANVNHSSTNCSDPMPIFQDFEAIQPKVGVEPHAIQAPRFACDGPQEISSDSSAKLQGQESHQAMSTRQIEGRTKAFKKRKKGESKLPMPEAMVLKSTVAHTTSEYAKPRAQEETVVEETCKPLDDSAHLEEKRKQSAFEIEAKIAPAATFPLEPISALLKYPETADQSCLLGCNPIDTNVEQPATSVDKVVKASGAKDDEMEVTPTGSILSAVSVEQSKEPVSQAMRRDVGSMAEGSAKIDLPILESTGSSSISQTECSNSISLEKSSPVVQAANPSSSFSELGNLRDGIDARMVSSSASQIRTAIISNRVFEEARMSQEARLDEETSKPVEGPREITGEKVPEILASLTPSAMGKESIQIKKEVQNPNRDESEGLQLGLIEENPQQASKTLSIHPSPSKSEQIFPMSPARERALSIPPRSSSLPALSTPIKTHQKKKPRNLTPVKEASSSKVLDLSLEDTKMGSSSETTESTKLSIPVLTIDPTAHALTANQPRDLPKPETPFLMDNGVRVAPPKINRPIVEVSNADRYYARKNYHQVFRCGNATQINMTVCSLDSLGLESHHNSSEIENGLENVLREAGFGRLSTTSPFTIKPPELAWLETIGEGGGSIENCNNKDEPVLILDKGKIGPVMSWDAWTKQQEMIEVVKKATAVKRIMTSSPPLPWTKIVSLRKQLSRFVTHVFSNAHEQQITNSRAQKSLKAKILLDTIPQRDSSISDMRKWSRRVSLFMDEYASKPSRAYSGSRKSITNSSGGSLRGISSQKQQPVCQYPIPINQPDPQNLAREHGRDEDAHPTDNTEPNYSSTTGQTTESEPSPSTCGRTTPSEDESTSSVILTPSAALNQVTKLKDLFVEMGEDHRRLSDDCYQFNPPQEEECMTIFDPELMSVGRELDEVEVEQGVKENKSHGDKGQALGYAEESQAINKTKEPTPTSSEEKPQTLKDLAHQKHTCHLMGVSFQSSVSNHTTITEHSKDEAQHIPPTGEHSSLLRGGYNAVAGRGIDGRRGGRNEASKDPWALPQGEKPWGSGCEGQGGKKKRERQ